jgi:transcriptional regulator GlxA family with amidase domain
MTLSILYTDGHRLLSLAAILDVFQTLNQFYIEDGLLPFFNIQLVGTTHTPLLPDSISTIPYKNISTLPVSSVIFIPAFKDNNMSKHLEANLGFIPWLIGQYQSGNKIASCCTGSFLLGATGLLNHKWATTHIDACDTFHTVFPEVHLLPHAVVTQSDQLYTSGGATSSFHVMLKIIEQCCGSKYAIRLAKYFAIDLDRNSQLYFDHFRPQLSQEDALVRSIQQTILERYSEIKNVEEAFDAIPSSRRNIIRRFKQATGMTPIRFLQKTKIESAKHLLETTNKAMLDIMLSSGYSDQKNFRLLFKSFTGLTPKDYRSKYAARGLQLTP